ncbi:MAG TPA: MarR family transcriptional regulator [Acidimicrobiales bacterium]|nr:MarR family transcriptional regulator [Acidimicrobiales bacterium]
MGDELDTGNPARVLARLARQVEHALICEDLSIQQYRLLAYLSHGDWAASRLADTLDVSKPSITALVDGLVKRGYVERRAFEGDRRRIDHVITKEGKAALKAGDRAVNARLEALAEHLPGDALGDALRALAAVESVLDANLREALAR